MGRAMRSPGMAVRDIVVAGLSSRFSLRSFDGLVHGEELSSSKWSRDRRAFRKKRLGVGLGPVVPSHEAKGNA